MPKMAYCLKFNPKILSKYQHGLAYVTNTDGRGIFAVNGIFKRGQKAAKPTFDLVNILCYVGGEIRDGFTLEKLKEGDLVPIIESNFSKAAGKAILQPVPIEEAAKLLVVPCYEKAKASLGGKTFINREVKRSFEFYERVSRFCEYSNEEEFIKAKGGNEGKMSFTYLDLRRPEFDAWWIEESELVYLGCPLPPVPMEFPEYEKLLLGGETMIDFMRKAGRRRSKLSQWKKQTLEKFSLPVNFERLSGICRHQSLWYTWKGDLRLGVTMLESAKKIIEDQNAKRLLNARNPVVDVFLSLTQIKLAQMGGCEGQVNKVNWQCSKGHQCKTCHASATMKRDYNALPGTWTLTCVDKDGRGQIGTETNRQSLVTALAVVKKVKCKGEFETCIKYHLKDGLGIFLEHSFVNLYWKSKPTPPMMAALIEEAVDQFVDSVDCDNFDPMKWTASCTSLLVELLVKHCHGKLLGEEINDFGKLFQEAFKSQIAQNILEVEKLPQYTTLYDDKASVQQLSSVMMARAVAPSIAENFLFKWKTMARVDKKETLSGSFVDLLTATRKVYEKYSIKKVSRNVSEGGNSTQACSKKGCVCQDLAKFQDFAVNLLSGGHSPVSFLSCSPEGKVMLSEDLFVDNSGELIDDMVLSCDMYIYEKIMDSDNLKDFANCPRLACLCQFACCEIYTMLKVNAIVSFKEITWKESAVTEMHCCSFCGQMANEEVTLMKCSACKAVVYCSYRCQRKDWKAGHKQKCQSLQRP